MKIQTTRRISQVFFLVLFIWFSIVATVGLEFWRLRGWPVNLFLAMDPLVALGTVLTTGKLYAGLIIALFTIITTILLGRVFCGWICPFGTMHQFFGWLGSRGKRAKERIQKNRYRKGQAIKYFILVAFLFMAFIPLGDRTTLMTGLLDPIPLATRSVNMAILPIVDRLVGITSVNPRLYEGAWIIGGLFIAALLMNFIIPRFYCRFVCPLGALLGIMNRFSLWRIAKTHEKCSMCGICNRDCEGACNPAGEIRWAECVMCMNCLNICPEDLTTYRKEKSAAGERTEPDLSRRGFIVSAMTGILALPLIRLGGKIGPNWYNKVIRPPGSLAEEDFLKRCIKCGQCMRVCPTNIIVPGGLEGGVENLWTPVLNFRTGTSGCQLNCTACTHVCPTAAIRPISLEEKLGLGEYSPQGPIRLGTAFVDRGRCLPWAMDRPCLVCQENCPVTPKAIYVKEQVTTVRGGVFSVEEGDGDTVKLSGGEMEADQYATGDHYLVMGDREWRITENTVESVTVFTKKNDAPTWRTGSRAEIKLRVYVPWVDPARCIGCGTCEHECPVSGKRAIRVSAENESRDRERSLLLKN